MKKADQILILSAFLLTFMLTKTINVMQDTKEIWNDVPGYEGIYEISNLGNVKSIPRSGTIKKEAHIISKQITKGYLTVHLSKDNKCKRKTIHRLMGLTFLSTTYFKGAVINHKNGIKTDNRVDNLEWVTHSQNTRHAWDNGLCTPARYWSGRTGASNATSIPIAQYTKDLQFIKVHVSATFAAKEINGNRQHISQCCSGTRKTSNGFIWKYFNNEQTT